MFHSGSKEVGTLRHERELTRLAESNEEPIRVLGHAASRQKIRVSVQHQTEAFVSANLWTWVSIDLTQNTVPAVQGPCSVLQTQPFHVLGEPVGLENLTRRSYIKSTAHAPIGGCQSENRGAVHLLSFPQALLHHALLVQRVGGEVHHVKAGVARVPEQLKHGVEAGCGVHGGKPLLVFLALQGHCVLPLRLSVGIEEDVQVGRLLVSSSRLILHCTRSGVHPSWPDVLLKCQILHEHLGRVEVGGRIEILGNRDNTATTTLL